MKYRGIVFSAFIFFLLSCQAKNQSESEAKIYGLVLLEILEKYGATAENTIYLKEELSELSESSGVASKKLTFSETVKEHISGLAKNKNLKLYWVSSTQKLEFENDSGKIIGGGVLVGFTKVHYSSSTSAEIEANIFISSEEAFGKKYSVELESTVVFKEC